MATEKRKRVSKKNKKSWRKHIDVSDVDNFLEEKRLEERLGVNFAESKNDDLFTLDTEPGVEKGDEPKPIYNKRTSLRLKETVTPRCFEILERRSAVPDPVIKRNRIKIREKLPKLRTPEESKKDIKKPELRNIWDEKDTTRELNGLAEWLTPDTIRHTLHNTGFKRRLRSRGLQAKPSIIAAVESPHPGMSYNPSLKDHRSLLEDVAATEEEIQKKEAHITRVTSKMFRKVPRDEAEKDWMTEMAVHLEPSSNSDSDAGDYSTVNPPVQRKKKTLQKRRKLREELEKKKQIAAKKMEKKKRSDVNEKLKELQQEIVMKEALSSVYRKRKEKRKQAKITETKELSQTKFAPLPLEFQGPSELSGSLRKLKPEGSVLMDRFKSLQRRNVLEPTQRRHVGKAKAKKFVKGSHRMGWEPKGY